MCWRRNWVMKVVAVLGGEGLLNMLEFYSGGLVSGIQANSVCC